MTITERRVGPVTILDLDGGLRLDDGAGELTAAVRRLLGEGRTRLVFNVGRVALVDSAGLGALVQAHVSVSRTSGAIRLVNTPARLRKLIAITKLPHLLPSFDDEPSALASFGPPPNHQ